MGKSGGEKSRVQGILGALAVEIAAEGADDPFVAEQSGLEEGQPADVIEVEVAEQDVDGVRGVVAQMGAEGCKTGARIDDEKPFAASDFDARGMASEFDELRAGRAGRATDPQNRTWRSPVDTARLVIT